MSTRPIPSIKPRRVKSDRLAVRWTRRQATAGTPVYAPRGGRVVRTRHGVQVQTRTRVHDLRGVTPRTVAVGKRVGEAEFIGRATGKRSVVYRVWDRQDATAKDAMKHCRRRRWYPGAVRMPATAGGDMSTGGGDTARCVPHWFGHRVADMTAVAKYTVDNRKAYTICYDPYPRANGRRGPGAIQTYPADVAARSMANASNLATNRYGRVCIQVGFNGGPDGWPGDNRGTPFRGRRRFIAWLETWGIPRRAARSAWDSGWITHAQHPGNLTPDMPYMQWDRILRP